MTSFIPNLSWSCRVLGIKDEALWKLIDRMLIRISKYITLENMQSIVPSYFELGRIGKDQDHLFDLLEKRFKELKQDLMT